MMQIYMAIIHNFLLEYHYYTKRNKKPTATAPYNINNKKSSP